MARLGRAATRQPKQPAAETAPLQEASFCYDLVCIQRIGVVDGVDAGLRA